jgi:hypothetical protein
MASVIGLAPIRLCLKGRVRELLCIHGRKVSPQKTRTQSCCSLADINSGDRRAFARMQVREADGEPHTFEFGGGVELAHRFAFDRAHLDTAPIIGV